MINNKRRLLWSHLDGQSVPCYVFQSPLLLSAIRISVSLSRKVVFLLACPLHLTLGLGDRVPFFLVCPTLGPTPTVKELSVH